MTLKTKLEIQPSASLFLYQRKILDEKIVPHGLLEHSRAMTC